MSIPINLVFEDEVSEAVMKKLLNSFNSKFYIGISYHKNGYGYIRQNINGFNQAAIATAFFVLADLDSSQCPTELISNWFRNELKPNMIFRLAIREIESWLLADREGFARFTGVSEAILPRNPDLEVDPKNKLIQIIRRCRKRLIKEDVIPKNDNANMGPNYNGRLIEYIEKFWEIDRAKRNSNSLLRTFVALERYEYSKPN